ncbi:hypothetical protein RB23_08940, partial [Francisella tularensis subsp. holarctica]
LNASDFLPMVVFLILLMIITLSILEKNNKDFINTISNIRHQIIQNQELVDFIKKKFAIKNTSGYSLNAFFGLY